LGNSLQKKSPGIKYEEFGIIYGKEGVVQQTPHRRKGYCGGKYNKGRENFREMEKSSDRRSLNYREFLDPCIEGPSISGVNLLVISGLMNSGMWRLYNE